MLKFELTKNFFGNYFSSSSFTFSYSYSFVAIICDCAIRNVVRAKVLTQKPIFLFLLLMHRCKAAFVVISIVVWEAMPLIEADNMYKLLVHKLNKFGLPTTRRCATNENRTCACQGIAISELFYLARVAHAFVFHPILLGK
jgi:hypothetical protein